MVYLYHEDAGKAELTLKGDMHRYIFKVRRQKVEDTLHLRTLQDDFIHSYTISYLDKSTAVLSLTQSKEFYCGARVPLHIAWCVIDPKSVEKVLPSLNEMGVEKITFLYCQRSQKSFKLDFKRFEKILLSSSQQSGRSKLMVLEMGTTLPAFLEAHPKSKMLNFSPNLVSDTTPIETIVIGCEGGFSAEEVALFAAKDIIGLDTPLVLKSESAVCAVASQVLL